MTTNLPDGIYLDLPFSAYLALPRVSAGSLTDMMESPAAFWARSWLNPDREEIEETEAMKLGRAYHCARLEPEKFEELFVRELVPEDFGEEILTTSTQVGEYLSLHGETKKKAGENAMDQAKRCRDMIEANGIADAPAIWTLRRHEWEVENIDKTWIGPKAWDEIRRDAERIRLNPELRGLIEGGFPEVSILWTDAETGLPCRARPDYLGSDWITHLKTWDAKAAGKPGNRAVADAFRFNGYYRTGWFYLEALNAMAEQELRFRSSDGKAVKPPTPELRQWQEPGTWDHWFLFVRRSGIPDIRAREVMFFDVPPGVREQSIEAEEKLPNFGRTITVLGRKAQLEVRACLEQVAECLELYGGGGDPWFPRDMIGRLEDEDFSDYWLESMDVPR